MLLDVYKRQVLEWQALAYLLGSEQITFGLVVAEDDDDDYDNKQIQSYNRVNRYIHREKTPKELKWQTSTLSRLERIRMKTLDITHIAFLKYTSTVFILEHIKMKILDLRQKQSSSVEQTNAKNGGTKYT